MNGSCEITDNSSKGPCAVLWQYLEKSPMQMDSWVEKLFHPSTHLWDNQ